MTRRVTPSLRAVFTNWRGPLPLRTKLRMTLANNWTKIRTRRNCCGHPGQPGC